MNTIEYVHLNLYHPVGRNQADLVKRGDGMAIEELVELRIRPDANSFWQRLKANGRNIENGRE